MNTFFSKYLQYTDKNRLQFCNIIDIDNNDDIGQNTIFTIMWWLFIRKSFLSDEDFLNSYKYL